MTTTPLLGVVSPTEGRAASAAHVARNSGEVEWFTPAPYVE